MAAEMGIELGSITGTGRSGLITKEDVSAAVLAHSASEQAQMSAEPVAVKAKQVSTPRARRVAREHGIDWRSLAGSGKNGRIREADVLAASRKPSQVNVPSLAATSARKLSPRRRAIADRLRRSQELTVAVTLHSTVDVTELAALRNRLKAANPALPPAFTDIVAALLPRVFKAHPQLAQVWDDSHQGLIPVPVDEIHIGIAVDTPEGLLVPVVRHVAGKSLNQITTESRRSIEQARSGGLPGEMMRGGTFTITNLGAFGIDGFTPVINLPEISILGLGAIRREPAFTPDGHIEPRERMTLSLTFDHAAVDGAPAAAFLRDIGTALTDPAAFLLNFG
jgi:pyruvate dehydrogenase E2 component (dihydrolipoamide acetyltransferase)